MIGRIDRERAVKTRLIDCTMTTCSVCYQIKHRDTPSLWGLFFQSWSTYGTTTSITQSLIVSRTKRWDHVDLT